MPFSSHYPRIWDHNTPTRSSSLSSSRDPTGPPDCQNLWWENAYLYGKICPKIGIGLSNFQNMVRIIPHVLIRSGLPSLVQQRSEFHVVSTRNDNKDFFGCCIIHMGPIEDLSLRFTFRLNLTLNIQVCLFDLFIIYPACPKQTTLCTANIYDQITMELQPFIVLRTTIVLR